MPRRPAVSKLGGIAIAEVATHEAGHAVAAYVLIGGSHLKRLRLAPADAPDAVADCGVSLPPAHGEEAGWLALAGPVAAQIRARIDRRRRPRIQRYHLAEARAAFGSVERWRLTAIRKWLESARVWPYVEKVAAAALTLNRGAELKGRKLLAILVGLDVDACRQLAERLRILQPSRLLTFLAAQGHTGDGHAPAGILRNGRSAAVACLCGQTVEITNILGRLPDEKGGPHAS